MTNSLISTFGRSRDYVEKPEDKNQVDLEKYSPQERKRIGEALLLVDPERARREAEPRSQPRRAVLRAGLDVEPFAYLRDVLERIVSGKTKANDLASLLPWAWKASQGQTAVNT